jgi:hypothetical protein
MVQSGAPPAGAEADTRVRRDSYLSHAQRVLAKRLSYTAHRHRAQAALECETASEGGGNPSGWCDGPPAATRPATGQIWP